MSKMPPKLGDADAEVGEALQYGRKPYCWNMMGWKYTNALKTDTELDSYEMKLRIKVEGERMVRGGIIMKGIYRYSIIQDKCKLEEWCTLDLTETEIPENRRNRWYYNRVYFATWYVPEGTTVTIDAKDYHVCGYDSKTFDINQLK